MMIIFAGAVVAAGGTKRLEEAIRKSHLSCPIDVSGEFSAVQRHDGVWIVAKVFTTAPNEDFARALTDTMNERKTWTPDKVMWSVLLMIILAIACAIASTALILLKTPRADDRQTEHEQPLGVQQEQ